MKIKNIVIIITACVIAALIFLVTVGVLLISFIADNNYLSPGDYENAGISQKQKALKYVSRKTGIDITDGDLYFGFDTHGGFHGDGTAYLEIGMPEPIDTMISENSEWHSLPVPGKINSNICKLSIDKHRGDYEDLLPEIKNGWYYFNDRTPDDAWDYMNFTFAAYDSDSNILYYCELDK